MKRFIRYLYEYEQGKRTRNVGFVKVEQAEDECIVHIHGKGLRLIGEDRLRISLFYLESGVCVCLPQGETGQINPSVNVQLRYTKEDVKDPDNYDRIEGIVLTSTGGRIFAVLWEDVTVDFSRMREWQQRTSTIVKSERLSFEKPEQEPAGYTIPEEPLSEKTEEETEESPGKEPEEMTSYPAENPLPEKTERFRKIRKIQRTEISRLARCEWRLANNRFLLHGYYNYHHLVLLEDRDCLLLGVPGIYHEKEAAAAADFGFPEFVPAEQIAIQLNPEESNEEERFGYWCRPVRQVQQWE